MLIAAAFSRYDDALDWGINQMLEAWGPILLKSPRFEFSETSFYAKEMGDGLKKQLLAFERLVDPADLPDLKIQSNAWERDYLSEFEHPEQRPLNLDPGYITEAKLVLATTKNRDHRIYLQKGIFAEITLFFQGNKWQNSRWTYPDYQREDFHAFFASCREELRKTYQSQPD